MRKKSSTEAKSSLCSHCNVQRDLAVLEKAISWRAVKCSKTEKYVRCPSSAAAGKGISLPQHQRIVSQSISQSIPISPYFSPSCCQQTPAIIFPESALRMHVPYWPDFLNKKEDGREKQHCLKHEMLQKEMHNNLSSANGEETFFLLLKKFLH